jgi:hypothetical protein
MRVELRPGVINRALWYPERRTAAWKSIRKQVLDRDGFCCQWCGHRALKGMHADHLASKDNSAENLMTVCVACNAVRHLGKNMKPEVRALAVYSVTGVTQVEIVQRTRAGIAAGRTLEEINKTFKLARGRYHPGSLQYANELIAKIGNQPRLFWKNPSVLCL